MSTDDTTPRKQFEPPEHIGEYWRRSWSHKQKVLSYTKLGSSLTYLIGYENGRGWIRERERSSSPLRPYESRWLSPDGEGSTDTTFDVEGFIEACEVLIEYLSEHQASFTVPQEINVWEKVRSTAEIAYQNSGNTATVRYRRDPAGTYSVYIERENTGKSSLTSGLETRADAVESLKNTLNKINPTYCGIPDGLELDSEYGPFERVDSGMNEFYRFEQEKGYRVVVRPHSDYEHRFTVKTSTGIAIPGLPPRRIENCVQKLVDQFDPQKGWQDAWIGLKT